MIFTLDCIHTVHPITRTLFNTGTPTIVFVGVHGHIIVGEIGESRVTDDSITLVELPPGNKPLHKTMPHSKMAPLPSQGLTAAANQKGVREGCLRPFPQHDRRLLRAVAMVVLPPAIAASTKQNGPRQIHSGRSELRATAGNDASPVYRIGGSVV